jgi:hypothetical protein
MRARRNRSALSIALSWWLLACASSEDEVKAEFAAFVERSNRCDGDSQCTLVATRCPLGCQVAVRADRAEAVADKAGELRDDYERGGVSCDYDCAAPGEPRCVQGRCAEISRAADAPDGRDCTLIGCGAAFSIAFDKSSAWAQGEYRVALTLDGDEVECSASLPLSCDLASACDDPAVLLQLSGCALPAASHALGGVELAQKTPAFVAVEVFFQGQALAAASFQPIYAESQPNGAQCEPTCRSAPPARLALP